MTNDDVAPAAAVSSEGVPAPDGPANLIDTDYVIGQDNIATTKWGVNLDLHGKVFTVSSLVILVFVILTLALQAEIKPVFDGIFSFVTGNLSWVFLLAATYSCWSVSRSPSRPSAGSGSAGLMPTPSSATLAGSPCCSPRAWGSA